MNITSIKQKAKNLEISKIKKSLPDYCVICGRAPVDAAHLLPKSIWPEWYTEPLNLTSLCRECHTDHDDRMSFRTQQTKLYEQVLKFDEKGAKRYYGRNT